MTWGIQEDVDTASTTWCWAQPAGLLIVIRMSDVLPEHRTNGYMQGNKVSFWKLMLVVGAADNEYVEEVLTINGGDLQ